MYAAGSDLLGLNPGDCLFIDDDPQLVSAAIQLLPIITRTAQRT
jgi:putative hydrolase of the HAD superfamily